MPEGLLNGSVISITGNNLIDAMTNGYRWQLDYTRTVDWSISNGWYGEIWNNPSDAYTHISAMLFTYSYYANIKFNYVGYYSSPLIANYAGSDINLALDQYSYRSSLWAIGNFPIPNDPSRGDIYININSLANSISYEPGSAGWFLGLHEIGHTLGLKHPHDSGGTGRPTFTQLGWTNLNIDYTTVMSYNDDYNYNLISFDPASPMILDVLALQYLYGKNMLTNAGDSTFVLTNSNMYLTLWDASGIDLVDQSSATEGWYIVLPSVQLTSLVDTMAGIGMPLSDLNLTAPRSLAWLAGDFENVVGSNFADQIYGNGLSNNISGGAGNDIIAGLEGNDVINCGDGSDTCNFNLSRSNYNISYSLGAFTVTALSGNEGTDTVTNVENFQFSDQIIAVSNLNQRPTGSISISGDLIEGRTLTAQNNFQDSDGIVGNIEYRWYVKINSGWAGISDGPSSSYVLKASDIGRDIIVQAVYTDGLGKLEVVWSDLNGVGPVLDDTSNPISIIFSPFDTQSNIPVESNIVVTFSEAVKFGTGAIEIHSGSASGPVIATYDVATNAGANLSILDSTLTINPTNDLGNSQNYYVTFASGAIKDIAGNNYTGITAYDFTTVAGVDTSAPMISIATNDSSLTVGETATISFTLSESSSNFELSDITALGGSLSNFSGSGASYSARFTPASSSTTNGVVSVSSNKFTDAAGNVNSASNSVTIAVSTVSNFTPTGIVSIKGTATQNQKLTASNTLKDADGLGAISYQWKSDGSNINGASSSSLTLTQAQVGKAITVIASYTDRLGNAESVSSSSTAIIRNINDKPTGAVTISGNAAQGQTLSVSNNISDVDGLGSISYQWQLNGKSIAGATNSSYTLTQSEVGATLSVNARYLDGQGTAESVTSRATAKVANVNDAPTVANIIPTQTVVEGTPFSFSIPTNTFTDLDKDKLTYSATFNGSAMTSSTWGQLSAGKFISKQVPYTAADTSDNTVVLTASDGKGGSVSTSFTLGITNTANINGTSNADTINAGNGADTINGLAGNDIISGGVGKDIIDGGLGNDRLTGGLDSADYFRFTTAIKSNIDTITDFVHGSDKIQLDDAIFTKFAGSSVQSTHLVAGSSTADVKATQLDDYLLYNTSTGQLYYDADGSGQGAAIQFANLVGVGTLTVDDFAII